MNETHDDATNSEQPRTCSRRRGRRRGMLLALAAIAGIGVAAYAVPAAVAGGDGGCRHRTFSAEDAREHAGRVADRVLGRVDATDAQRAVMDEALDHLVPELVRLHGEGRGLRDRFMAALERPTLDRAEIEALRVEAIGLLDKATAAASADLADALDALTPEQRADLTAAWRRHHR